MNLTAKFCVVNSKRGKGNFNYHNVIRALEQATHLAAALLSISSAKVQIKPGPYVQRFLNRDIMLSTEIRLNFLVNFGDRAQFSC